MEKTALILGASGRFGRHAAEAFWNAGWRVRLFDRQKDDLMVEAQGATVIVNAWNPPYDRWPSELPGLTHSVIAAAQAADATVLIPGNVYVFGKDAPEEFGLETPQLAANELGRLRIEMEDAFRQAGVKTIVLRAGDYLDTEPSGNWFDRILAAKIDGGRLRYPGPVDVSHAWAFLPDVAKAAVALAEQAGDAPRFLDVGFPGYTLTGTELTAACAGALGRSVRVERMSWLPLRLSRPVWPMAGRLIEMSYLWRKPHRIDGRLFDRLLPNFVPTPLVEALRSVLQFKVGPDQPVPRREVAFAAQ